MVAILDTNVWVSAFLNPHGHPAKLKDAWIKGKFEVIICPLLVNEITSVLGLSRIKDKYHLLWSEIESFIQLLILRAITVFPTGKFKLCRDKRDNDILEAALLGDAKCLVTRDDDIKRDLELIKEMRKYRIRVLSVSQFLKEIK